MKRLFILGMVLLVAMGGGLPVFAASYIDELDKLVNDGAKSYTNLVVIDASGSASWQALPDTTFASFTQRDDPIGSVTYQVTNASKVTIGLYTHMGTYVRPASGSQSASLGTSLSNARPTGATHALYSFSENRILTYGGGGLMEMVYSDFYYIFDDYNGAAPGDLIPYGVNVYAISASGNISHLTLQNTGSTNYPLSSYCYETFTAYIPSGSKQVKVEINDISVIPIKTGGVMVKGNPLYTSLASVTFEGEGLYLGKEEDVESGSSEETGEESSEEESSQEESEESGSSSGSSSKFEGSITSGSSRSASSRSAATSTTIPRASSSTPSAGSSASSGGSVDKFTGSTASANKVTGSAGGGGSSRQAADKVSSPMAEGSATGSVSVFETPAQGMVYRVLGEEADEDSVFSLMVTVYIVLVCGIVLFVLLRCQSGGEKDAAGNHSENDGK